MAKAGNVFEEIDKAEVILFDAQLNPVCFTFTGNSGEFGLKNLPYGLYELYVDYPGKYSRYTSIWLDSATQVVDSVQLELFDHDVTAVPGHGIPKTVVGDLFPNPANDVVNFMLNLPGATAFKFEIRSLTGTSVWSGSGYYGAGSTRVSIPVTNFKAGLYLLWVNTLDGSPVAVKKLLRY
jgi:hypothetical protein